jgi:hypothetical protein
MRVLALVIGAALLGVLPAAADASPGWKSWQVPAPSAPGTLRSVSPEQMAVATAARSPRRGGTYGGGTSVGDPIVISLSSNRRSVTSIAREWRATCASGIGYPTSEVLRGKLSIDSAGRFAGASEDDVDLGGGLRGARSDRFEGQIRGKRVSGRWVGHTTVTDASGATVDTCDIDFSFSGRSAKGKVYGGSTTQFAPVVVERGRKKVGRVRIGWQGSCSPSGSVQFGEDFTDFALKRGRFGDDFDQHVPFNDGGSADFHFSLHGRLGRGASSGSFRATAVRRDSGGSEALQCDSGPIRWKARTG